MRVIKILQENEIKILKVFTGNITKTYNITDLNKILKLKYSALHRSIQPLVKNEYLLKDRHNYSLNYKKHQQELAYVEYLRSKAFLGKPKNDIIAMFLEYVLVHLEEYAFVLILFGSVLVNSKPNDVDILLITDQEDNVERVDKRIKNIARKFTLPFDITTVSYESAIDMLKNREKYNVLNNILNNHLIIHGSEIFFNLLKMGRT